MYRVWDFVTNYSLLLIAGALIALVWANTHPESYHHLVHFTLIDHFFIGHAHYDAAGQVAYRTLTLHYLVVLTFWKLMLLAEPPLLLFKQM